MMLKRIFILICISSACFASDEKEFLSHTEVDGDPSTFVAGCVNAITGTFNDMETDISIPGPEPLTFCRYYSSSDWRGGVLCDSWTYNHAQRAHLHHHGGKYIVVASEASGGSILYKGNKVRRIKAKDGRFYLVPDSPIHITQHLLEDKGLTNTNSWELSGRTNLKNQTSSFNPSNNELCTYLCDGSMRSYTPVGAIDGWAILPIDFSLLKETRPNGNQVKYDYYRNKKNISQIQRCDEHGAPYLGSLHFDYTGCSNLSGPICKIQITSHDERKIELTFSKHSYANYKRWYLTHVKRPNAPPITYDYTSYGQWIAAFVCRKGGVDGRFIEIDYYRHGDNIVGKEKVVIPAGRSDFRISKVSCLKAPAGPGPEPITTHYFTYGNGFTDVFDAYNRKTRYHYGKDERLSAIELYTGTSNHALYSTEKFFWGKAKNNQNGNLICKTLIDTNGSVRSCKTFSYDNSHNVICEKIYGNLSGICTIAPEVSKDGIPIENGCESYSIYRTYSTDSFHHLLEEKLPNGRTIKFSYKPNTQLIEAKWTYDRQDIVAREFHEYNTSGVEVKTITDNGSAIASADVTDVTCRKITYITPTIEPHGLPHIVENYYWESGEEILLSKKVNSYSKEGWLTRQEYYDSTGNWRYCLEWDYDFMGNATMETNALGEITVRTFDGNRNKTSERILTLNYSTHYTYDFSNRLIAEEIIYDSGERHRQSYEYDFTGNRTAHIDILGNKTCFSYDEMGRLIKTSKPLNCTSTQSYDVAGNIVRKVDPLGNITLTTYNCRKQPTHIHYPDGSHEYFEYSLDGLLKCQTAKNGTKTHLAYDSLGNVICKKVAAGNGELLTVTSASYKGNLITQETNANGNLTTYEYDGAGRLIMTQNAQSWTKLEYDLMGFIHKKIQWTGPDLDDVVVTITERDYFNRVLEERVEDKWGNIRTHVLTEYDPAGNPCSITNFSQTGPCVTQTFFNALGKPYRIIDPCGNETSTQYDYSPQGLSVTVVDPLGNQTFTQYNALGQPDCIIRKDSYATECSRVNCIYNANGQLTRRIDVVKAGNVPIHDMITEWQYDTLGRITGLFEAVDTPQRRVTLYTYNSFGERIAEIFADSSSLHYQYDAMGRLSNFQSSDGSVHYEYTYDGNSNILSVADKLNYTVTNRIYDEANRVIQENLDNGFSISYCYNGLNNTTAVLLPDGSSILYDYEGSLIKKVTRMNAKDEELYSHHYLAHDTSGLLLEAQLIGNCGNISYSYDSLGRKTEIVSKHFSEYVPDSGYDAVGNLLSKQQTDVVGQVDCRYMYDSLYQLVSEEGTQSHQYSYDSLHNRLQKDDKKCEVNALNQIVSQGDLSYQYDPCGRRIHQGQEQDSLHYTYDILGRLIAVVAEKERVEYHYDPFNRCTSKTYYKDGQTAVLTKFLYQDQMEIASVVNDEIQELRLLGQGLGADIGAAVAIELKGQPYAPIHDHNGNIVALLRASSGKVEEAYRYSAFGEVTAYQYSWIWGWIETQKPKNPWQFSSKRFEKMTKLNQFGRRWYDAELGRWLTPDPKGFIDGPNLYAYVHNCPLTHIDLYGLLTEPNLPSLRDHRRHRKNADFSAPPRRSREPQIRNCRGFERLAFWAPRSHNLDLGKKSLEAGCIGFTPGVSNDRQSTIESAEYISSLANDANVYATVNQTHLCFDSVEVGLGLNYIATDPVYLLHEKWDSRLEQHSTILEIASSQGCLHVRNALMSYPEDKRNRIFVLAIAPAAYIDAELCRKVVHYRTEDPLRDLIPRLFDKRGEARAIAQGTVFNLKSHPDASYIDHAFASPTYTPHIALHVRRYISNQGNEI